MKILSLAVLCFFFQSVDASLTITGLSVLNKPKVKPGLLFSLSPVSKELPHEELDEQCFLKILELIRNEEKSDGYHMFIQVSVSPDQVQTGAESQKHSLTDLYDYFAQFRNSSFADIEVSKLLRGAIKIFLCDDPRYFTRHFLAKSRDAVDSVHYRELSKKNYDCELDTVTFEGLLKEIDSHLAVLESLIRHWKDGRKDLAYFGSGVGEELEKSVKTMKDLRKQLADLVEKSSFGQDETLMDFAQRLWEVSVASTTAVPSTQDEALSKNKLRENNNAVRLNYYQLLSLISKTLNEAFLFKRIVQLEQAIPLKQFIVITQDDVASSLRKTLLSHGYTLEDDYYRTTINSQVTLQSRKSLTNLTPQGSTASCTIQ